MIPEAINGGLGTAEEVRGPAEPALLFLGDDMTPQEEWRELRNKFYEDMHKMVRIHHENNPDGSQTISITPYPTEVESLLDSMGIKHQ